MENTNNLNYWNKIKELKKNQPLTFIHIPKCAGGFVTNILKKINVNCKGGHDKATKSDGITFAILRNPAERFESLINYRLSEPKPRIDWPKTLRYVWKKQSISLNNIISKMSNKDIINFYPYRTQCSYSTNIDIFITIDKLEEFLSVFGYEINVNEFKKINVSTKIRGNFNKVTKNRIYRLYSDDLQLYNRRVVDYTGKKEK